MTNALAYPGARMLRDPLMIERNIPAAVVLAILVQTGAAFWWASALSTRVDHLDRTVMALVSISDRTTRLEARMDDLEFQIRRAKP